MTNNEKFQKKDKGQEKMLVKETVSFLIQFQFKKTKIAIMDKLPIGCKCHLRSVAQRLHYVPNKVCINFDPNTILKIIYQICNLLVNVVWNFRSKVSDIFEATW